MESEALRWILLGIGIAGIAAIWLAASARSRTVEKRSRDREPRFGDDHAADITSGEMYSSPLEGPDRDDRNDRIVIRSSSRASKGDRKQEPGPAEEGVNDWQEDEELIVVLYVVARPPSLFTGPELVATFDRLDLRFGDMNIYHRDGAHGKTIFSLVNMVNPGIFDPETMATFTTRGVSLFTVLPAAGDGVAAFDAMFDAASAIASQLGGAVLDESRSAVTRQGCEHIRDRIREFELKLRRPHGRRP